MSALQDFDIQVSELPSDKVLPFYGDLLAALGARSVFRGRPASISHVAIFDSEDHLGGVRHECWCIVPLETDGAEQIVTRLLAMRDVSWRARVIQLSGIASYAFSVPDAAQWAVLLMDRNKLSSRMPDWVATVQQSADVPVRYWGRDDIDKHARAKVDLLKTYFDPISIRLAKELEEKREVVIRLESVNEQLRRTEQERQWLAREKVLLERDAIWKQLAQRIAHKFGNPINTVGMAERNIRSVVEGKLRSLIDNILNVHPGATMVSQSPDSDVAELGPFVHDRDNRQEVVRLLDLLTKSLNNLRTAIGRFQVYLDEFKDYSKAMGVYAKPTPASQLIVLARETAAAVGIPIDTTVTMDARESVVSIDLEKLRQVFEELTGNARSIIETTPGYDNPRLSIQISVYDRESDAKQNRVPQLPISSSRYVVVSFSDNGPGVPADLKEWIFYPYSTKRTDDSGTGQGLAIAARIVESHQGVMLEDGTEGEGARFKIFLPSAETSDEWAR